MVASTVGEGRWHRMGAQVTAHTQSQRAVGCQVRSHVTRSWKIHGGTWAGTDPVSAAWPGTHRYRHRGADTVTPAGTLSAGDPAAGTWPGRGGGPAGGPALGRRPPRAGLPSPPQSR